MRELVGPGYVARCIDVRVQRLQVFIGVDGAANRNAESFQPVTFEARHTADGAN